MFTNIDRIQLASGINGMLGTWLVISPWALGFLQDQTATGNSVIAGVMVATFGLVRAYGAYQSAWISWANTVIGGWVVVAPWVVDYGQGAVRTNSVLVGCRRYVVRGLERHGAACSTPELNPVGDVAIIRDSMLNNPSCHEVSSASATRDVPLNLEDDDAKQLGRRSPCPRRDDQLHLYAEATPELGATVYADDPQRGMGVLP